MNNANNSSERNRLRSRVATWLVRAVTRRFGLPAPTVPEVTVERDLAVVAPEGTCLLTETAHSDQPVACAPPLPRNKKVNTIPARNPPMCAMYATPPVCAVAAMEPMPLKNCRTIQIPMTISAGT